MNFKIYSFVIMKLIIFLLVSMEYSYGQAPFNFITDLFSTSNNDSPASDNYQGSNPKEIWDQVACDPYDQIPLRNVTLGSFFSWGKNLIAESSKRTVSNRNDLLPPFKKLIHANGICLKGEWIITEEGPYSGLFRTGVRSDIIARASVPLSSVHKGEYRAMGLAGKIYPSRRGLGHSEGEKFPTANFFTINDFTGTLDPHFTDAVLTTAPPSTPRLTALALAPLALAIANAFDRADIRRDTRQVYPLASLGVPKGEEVRSPVWMMVTASEETKREVESIQESDFRQEIQKQIRDNGKMEFDISVADTKDSDTGEKNWKKIGRIVFSEAVISKSCDERLHFHHHKFDEKFPVPQE